MCSDALSLYSTNCCQFRSILSIILKANHCNLKQVFPIHQLQNALNIGMFPLSN